MAAAICFGVWWWIQPSVSTNALASRWTTSG
jgi:hypothetical protein